MNHADTVSGSGRIVIVEPNPDGHRLNFVRVLAGHSESWAWVASSEATKSNERALYLAELDPIEVRMTDLDPRTALRTALDLARSTHAELIVVPDGDKYLSAVLTSRACWQRKGPRVTLNLLRSSPPTGPVSQRAKLISKMVMANLTSLQPPVTLKFITDAFGVVQRRKGYWRIGPAPDAVDDSSAQSSELPAELTDLPDRLSVGIFGGVAARKNPAMLVAAAVADGSTTVVLGGRVNDKVMDELRSRPDWQQLLDERRVIVIDRLLTPPEFDACLRRVDFVAALHDNESPSGIQAEAALRGTPSFVASGGWLETVAKTLDCGIVSDLNVHSVQQGLSECRERLAEVRANATECGKRVNTEDFARALLGDQFVARAQQGVG